MRSVNADPREQFSGRDVRSCGIGFDIGHYRRFVGRHTVAGTALRRRGFKREEAKHFNAMPRYWRAAGDVVADRSRATAQCPGDRGD